jgi:sec-independent protein translocase protein TatA
MGLDNPLHILALLLIVLLVFGARRLPEIGRSLGTGLREFKQSVTGDHPQQQQTLTAAQPPAQPQQTPQPQQAPAQQSPAQQSPTPPPAAG